MSAGGEGAEGSEREGIELLCIRNLLANAEERIYFKDRECRFLMVSQGWLATVGRGRPREEVLGRTDFDIFSVEHATAAEADERVIMATGEPLVGKVEFESHLDGNGTWVSTTKLPLRDETGEIIGTFGISRDISAQVRAQDDLAFQALHDPLTGLVNRVGLTDRLAQALIGLERRPDRVGLVFIDLDRFKTVNDTHGHDAGDRLLAEVAVRLRRVGRRGDTIARLGGDEFVILCPELRDGDCLKAIGHRVVTALREPRSETSDLGVTASAGVADTCDPAATSDELLRNADLAMYAAKSAGGDRCEAHTSETDPLARAAAPRDRHPDPERGHEAPWSS